MPVIMLPTGNTSIDYCVIIVRNGNAFQKRVREREETVYHFRLLEALFGAFLKLKLAG